MSKRVYCISDIETFMVKRNPIYQRNNEMSMTDRKPVYQRESKLVNMYTVVKESRTIAPWPLVNLVNRG